MKISHDNGKYSISNMTVEEFTAIILGLADYSEKRGTDTTGYNMLYSFANAAEQLGNERLARSIKELLPE